MSDDDPQSPFRLNRTRIFLIVMLLVALGLSVTTIVGSLRGWQVEDAAPAQPASAE